MRTILSERLAPQVMRVSAEGQKVQRMLLWNLRSTAARRKGGSLRCCREDAYTTTRWWLYWSSSLGRHMVYRLPLVSPDRKVCGVANIPKVSPHFQGHVGSWYVESVQPYI